MVARETRISEALEGLGVSRLTRPDTAAKLAQLSEILETEGVRRGLLSARDTSRIISRHILECAALQSWLPLAGRVIDVGSGAGLPGLVLAAMRSDPVVLVEAAARRAAFLRDVSYELGLRTEVVSERAEVAAQGPWRETADAVVARALARVPVALELTLPLARVGGLGALLVGSDDAARAGGLMRSTPTSASRGVGPFPASVAAAELGGEEPAVHGFEVPGAEERRWVMIVRKIRPTPDQYPRSAQARKRRPLGGDVA